MALDAFAEATQKFLADHAGDSTDSSSQDNKQAITAENNSQSPDNNSESTQSEVEQAIYELKTGGKFRYNGKYYTEDDIKRMQQGEMRLADYTKKTQGLAEERKSFESERKYNDNLYYDLEAVRQDPRLASKFVETYPEKYHVYLKDMLSKLSSADVPTATQTHQVPRVDPSLMNELAGFKSELNQMKKSFTEQEKAKVTLEIEQQIQALEKKYPYAEREILLARAYETHSKGVKMTAEVWEEIAKSVDSKMKDLVKAKYGDLVKKQAEANNKAKDVDSGGGTVGKAPTKFKRIEDVGKFAAEQMSKR